MLSPADEEVCARDAALPGLASVLDAEALAGRAGLGALRQSYLRYKHGTSCVVGLVPTDGSLRAFAAMTYPHDRYAEVRARKKWLSGPDPVLFLDESCTAIVPLSRDRNVKAAGRICHAEHRRRYLAALGLPDGPLSLLRYKPGRRLVVRLDDAAGPRAVFRGYAEREFANAIVGARHASGVAHVPVLGVEEDRRSIAVQWIDGRPLCPTQGHPADFHATGAELARLHAQPLAAALPDSGAGERRAVLAAADALALLIPRLADAARGSAASLAERMSAERSRPVPVHGDFSADQVVLSESGPVVIDWDRAAAGDPRRDLGCFLASLDAQVIAGALTRAAADTAGEALLEGYAQRTGAAPPCLAAWRAAALFALAVEPFRARDPEWPARAEAILDQVEALTGGSSAGGDGWRTTGVATALDVAAMRPRLAAVLGQSQTGDLSAQLVRHKPARRALIRYQFGGEPPILGKLRAKGPDRRTPELHAALRSAGLDGNPPHRVGVPAALGSLDDPPLWFQTVVDGRPLTECLLSGGAIDAARRAGTALALLHGAGIQPERAWSMADELAVLDRALDRARAAHPGRRKDIDAVATSAHAAAATLGEATFTGIHRDFHPDQVMIGTEAVWLLDLDLYAHGDPVIDVANFLAHMTELGLRERDDPSRFAGAGRAFLAGYDEERAPVDPRRLSVLHWIALARHIHISDRFPDRRHTTQRLISLCAAGLDARAPCVIEPCFGGATASARQQPLHLP